MLPWVPKGKSLSVVVLTNWGITHQCGDLAEANNENCLYKTSDLAFYIMCSR